MNVSGVAAYEDVVSCGGDRYGAVDAPNTRWSRQCLSALVASWLFGFTSILVQILVVQSRHCGSAFQLGGEVGQQKETRLETITINAGVQNV